MTESKALMVVNDFDTMQKVSVALYESGYFPNVKSQAQALVKVMAGAELGLPPFASMAGIHIVNGKPVIGSNVIATLVKNDPRYDYRIAIDDDELCQLTWYENGKQVGTAGFTIDEAKRAALTGKDNWRKYPSDMLFARAISRGARRFAPGIFGGAPVYTPDEMGVDENPDGFIEGELVKEPVMTRVQEPIITEVQEQSLDEANDMLIAKREADEARSEPDGEDYAEQHEETPLPPEDERVPDAEAAKNWLRSKIMNGRIQLGIIGDSVSEIQPFYGDWKHVKNTLVKHWIEIAEEYDFPTDFNIIRATRVTEVASEKIQDWLITHATTE